MIIASAACKGMMLLLDDDANAICLHKEIELTSMSMVDLCEIYITFIKTDEQQADGSAKLNDELIKSN